MTEGTNVDQLLMIAEFEDILFAIRKDLGLNNEKLKRGDLLRLFLTKSEEQYVKMPPRAKD